MRRLTSSTRIAGVELQFSVRPALDSASSPAYVLAVLVRRGVIILPELGSLEQVVDAAGVKGERQHRHLIRF
jgi:hypothetical protein